MKNKTSFGVLENFSNYIIYNDGSIYSLNFMRFIKSHKDSKGYFKIRLVDDDGLRCSFRVHRLVATVFIHNPENKPQVNHIDGCKENNHSSNLEWVDNSENVKHAWNNGLINANPKKGEDMYASKLTNEIVLSMRSSSLSIRELASKYGISYICAYKVIKRITWKHL